MGLNLQNLHQAGRAIHTAWGIMEFDLEGILKEAEKFPEEALKELGKLPFFSLGDNEAKTKADDLLEQMRKEQEEEERQRIEALKKAEEEAKANKVEFSDSVEGKDSPEAENEAPTVSPENEVVPTEGKRERKNRKQQG